MKPILSVEYCHVTYGQDPTGDIHAANAATPPLLTAFEDQYDVWPYLMIDDLRTTETITNEFVEGVVERLITKPRSVYLESSFVFPGEDVFTKIKDKHLTEGEEGKWLKRVKDSYGSTTDFVVSWKDKLNLVNFSCPTLVTTSYLYRLGELGDTLEPFWGERLVPAKKLLNVLDTKYMQTEANAHALLESHTQKITNRIQTFFY